MNSRLISDLERARARWPGLSDRERVARLAADAIDELGLEPPIDPAILASYRGIDRIEETRLPWAGSLSHEDGQTVMRVRRADSRLRRRFTAFHEIEHTYLPGYAVTQYRCNPGGTVVQTNLEQLADAGASELLMPRRPFLLDVGGSPPTFDLVDALSDRYASSRTATAVRVAQLARHPVMLICFEVGVKPSAPTAEPMLRVRWSSVTGRWPFIPRYKSVSPDGPFGRALEGEVVDEMSTIHDLATPTLSDVFVSARPMSHLTDEGVVKRVLALVSRAGE